MHTYAGCTYCVQEVFRLLQCSRDDWLLYKCTYQHQPVTSPDVFTQTSLISVPSSYTLRLTKEKENTTKELKTKTLIITVITRRVAVYLGTHCNIGSKTACCPRGSDVEPWRQAWRRVIGLK